METKNIIIRRKHGWYNFEKIDQKGCHIKIHNARCGSDVAAINQARRMLHDKDADVKIMRDPDEA